MEYIVNIFFIGIYRRNILKCECINVDKSLYLKGIEGIVEGRWFVLWYFYCVVWKYTIFVNYVKLFIYKSFLFIY